ncbi:hypothetical protein K1T71_005063 [Dendrolimus kikuchii]|uniref:Uncharacterized protein n=1 Tax=Dendrolimus kikuchii TaxID=765133 RepID=A0ACC1D652_9NEOP|nr:hypothetical protein K1T71_005063 [Dendrolimus kikuchii]
MVIGKKQLAQLSGFTSTILSYGVAAFIGMVYLTDWRVIVNYIPLYNTKFSNEKKPEC